MVFSLLVSSLPRKLSISCFSLRGKSLSSLRMSLALARPPRSKEIPPSFSRFSVTSKENLYLASISTETLSLTWSWYQDGTLSCLSSSHQGNSLFYFASLLLLSSDKYLYLYFVASLLGEVLSFSRYALSLSGLSSSLQGKSLFVLLVDGSLSLASLACPPHSKENPSLFFVVDRFLSLLLVLLAQRKLSFSFSYI
jgi:hypothetical protein